jgi:hypothetical protein
MNLDEHILRITERRNPKPNLESFALTICMHHRAIDAGLGRASGSSHHLYLPALFEGLVRFFCDAPPEVNVLEALKLSTMGPEEKAEIARYSWFEFFATLHKHMSWAFESAKWLEDQFVIMDAGPDMPEDGWQGAPVSFATAINTVVAFAEARGIDLAEALDEAQKRFTAPLPPDLG